MRRARPLRQVEARAYHEAGHVLVALLEGFDVRRVTISRHGRLGGACDSGFAIPRHAPPRVLRGLVGATAAVALAGSAAQRRAAVARAGAPDDPRQGSPLFAPGAEDDARIASRFARRIHGRPAARRAFLERVRARVEQVLDDPCAWAAVRRLARALLRERTLEGGRAAAIARRALADELRRARVRAE